MISEIDSPSTKRNPVIRQIIMEANAVKKNNSSSKPNFQYHILAVLHQSISLFAWLSARAT